MARMMSHRSRCFWTAVSFLPLLLLVAGCGTAASDFDAGSLASAPGMTKSGEFAIAPDFRVRDLDGNVVQLVDTTGDVRLIVFWATWCPPCREEIPLLNDLHTQYGEDGLHILAISDESESVLRAFAKQHEMIYSNLVDDGEAYELYRPPGLPMALLVDGDGRIRDTFNGKTPRRALEPKIRELLNLLPLSS
ncbi:MAG: TlpA family protein disulfide reductase [Acidobacteriota bacterium]|nr:TlpA family protein disulfide reductase [Acidobacteriota bacterium]MDH3785090.1 TlpA family protein disulfide reductase [Acidobacteriota bacterium]